MWCDRSRRHRQWLELGSAWQFKVPEIVPMCGGEKSRRSVISQFVICVVAMAAAWSLVGLRGVPSWKRRQRVNEQAVLERAKQIAARAKPLAVWELPHTLEDEPPAAEDPDDGKEANKIPLTQSERTQFLVEARIELEEERNAL